MHYMMDIETHTVIYLRDLLATRAANDPHITAFLSCWVYEELWHGEAFSDFLRAYGLEVPAEPKLPDGSTPMPTRPHRIRQLREKLGVGHQLAPAPDDARLDGHPPLHRVHMTWGAINELTTLTGYYALIRRPRPPGAAPDASPDHPGRAAPLRLLPRAGQGAARGRAARGARRLVRWIFENFWTPVGAGVKSQEEVDALCLYLFGDSDEGREQSARSTPSISELPGLEGLTLLEDVPTRRSTAPGGSRVRRVRCHRSARAVRGRGRVAALSDCS